MTFQKLRIGDSFRFKGMKTPYMKVLAQSSVVILIERDGMEVRDDLDDAPTAPQSCVTLDCRPGYLETSIDLPLGANIGDMTEHEPKDQNDRR